MTTSTRTIVLSILRRLVRQRPAPTDPRRIVLILTCCIGDVIMGTATLAALRRAYPNAQITWAVSGWSKAAIAHHNLLNGLIDTGPEAVPARTPAGFIRLLRQLRAGQFDLSVSLTRSVYMSAAALLSGIPNRAGLDSVGLGFGYTVRAPIDPKIARLEGDVYLDAARALGLDVRNCWANVPVDATDAEQVRGLLAGQGLAGPYLVVNPAGGRNPGMVLDIKRYPPDSLAELTNRLAARLKLAVVVIGGPGDTPLVEQVSVRLSGPHASFSGTLSFGEIAALAHASAVYIGNDTGLTHLAAAAGARTVMIFGPSDPARYAPFVPDALAVWRPVALKGGVSAGAPPDWRWPRDGISVDEAEAQIIAYLGR